MEFFEFFFSGPGWGWKVFGLMCLISVFGELILKGVNVVLKQKTDKFRIEIENAMMQVGKKNTEDVEGTPATKDDVRS
jgi:hypothetical protein